MACYRDGGCGPYEMLSCNECPASKPSYLERERKKCSLCSIKPVFFGGKQWSQWDSSISLADGGWTGLRACKDWNDKLAIYAVGDEYSDLYYPKFCPECGRELDQ